MPGVNSTPVQIEQFLGSAGQLYSLPRVAMQVLEMTDRPDPDKQALKTCIEADPALTSKLLRVVNSSLFGLSKRVGDLHQAISLLGVKPLKLLVLGFSLPEGLFRNLTGEFLSRYWQHSLVKAVAAREIAQQAWRLPGDEIFVAGLLQDLGVLALTQELGASYADFVARLHASQADVRDAERRTLGFDRSELTARLLTQWKLPANIVHCVQPPDSFAALELLQDDERLGSHILHLADRLALLLVERRADLATEVRGVAQRVHGLDDSKLMAVVGSVQAKLQPLAQVFSLELPEGLDYQDVLAQSQRQMVELATDAAAALVGDKRRSCDMVVSLSESLALTQAAEARFAAPNGASKTSPAPRNQVAKSTILNDDISSTLRAAAAECRQARRPLAVAVLEVDNREKLPLLAGPDGWEVILAEAERFLAAQEPEGARRLSLGEARWTLILSDCDRLNAARWGRDLVAAFREACARRWPKSRPTLSVGVAAVPLPARNFDPAELRRRAEQCLSGAQSSGGNCLKSVEI